MNTAITTDSNTPPRTPSRHYFYRKASLPSNTNANNINNNNNTNNGYTPTTPPITLLNDTESTNAFESKLEAFIKKQSVKTSVDSIFKEAANDLARRKADRRARKEKEEQQRNGEKQSAVNEKLTTELIEQQQQQSQEPLFEKLSILTPSEKSAWLSNIHDEAMLLNPHQWLKLASLFNVNSKATRQQTLLKDIPYLPEVLDDRSITVEQVRPLENYLELRDIQNRNYARDS